MRKYLLQIIGLAVIVTTIYSCKLDKPILPGQPGYVYVAPPGTGTGQGTGNNGGGGGIDTSLLTGTWKVKLTTSIIYSDGKVATSQPSIINLFTDVQIDNSLKTALFDGSFSVFDTTSYTTSATGGKTYIEVSEDPFQRSGNTPIQIQSLTATTMTWLAIDPLVVSSAGHNVQTAWQVSYTKQ